jgi:hypothetical protein
VPGYMILPDSAHYTGTTKSAGDIACFTCACNKFMICSAVTHKLPVVGDRPLSGSKL